MSEVTFETLAYAKIILHAAKYPHCAVNGILLAESSKAKESSRELLIVDVIPLFHHSHYVSPMAEVALTQIESAIQSQHRVIAGYYAACENFNDNIVEKCPGIKIAEKITDYFPGAVFVVVDNKKFMKHQSSPAMKLHKFIDGKWKQKDWPKNVFQATHTLDTVAHLLEAHVQKDLIDFDNYLDDLTQDWTNLGIEKLIASINASSAMDAKDDYR